ncbi:unnamed protein product [Mucor fragilis]
MFHVTGNAEKFRAAVNSLDADLKKVNVHRHAGSSFRYTILFSVSSKAHITPTKQLQLTLYQVIWVRDSTESISLKRSLHSNSTMFSLICCSIQEFWLFNGQSNIYNHEYCSSTS